MLSCFAYCYHVVRAVAASHLVAVFGHVRLRPLEDILPRCLRLLLSVSCGCASLVGPVLIPLSLLENGLWHAPCHCAIGPNNERDKAPPCARLIDGLKKKYYIEQHSELAFRSFLRSKALHVLDDLLT